MHCRHLVALAALAAAATACAAPTTDEVGPVTLDVPGDWVVDDRLATTDDAIIEERRWHPRGDPSSLLQVIVGCGDGDAESLREALTEAYQVRDELPATDVEVVGLDSAQRVALALRSDPTGDADGEFRLEGLYGAGSGGLLVVEFGTPVDDHDPDLVDDVLGSVEVDAGQLASRCAFDGD